MSKFPEGLGIKEEDGGFTLARTINGVSTEVFLSFEETLGFMNTISSWKARHLEQLQVKSGQVQPVVVSQVARFGIGHNALKTDVLLSLAVPTGEQTMFSIPPDLAQGIATQIPLVLAAMVEDEQTPS
jgi:hypothetical protein